MPWTVNPDHGYLERYDTGGSLGAILHLDVDVATPPGTDPVDADGSGTITITGGQTSSGTTSNVIRTHSTALNEFTIEVQRSATSAVSTIDLNGVSHFDSAFFTIDGNGFVSAGGGLGQTITGNTGTISPTAGNWNIVTANSTPIFAGSGSTLTLDFGLSNLILGSSAPLITTASENVGLGLGSLQSLTSGLSNTCIGWESGALITTAINNVLIGAGAGGNLSTSLGNVAIGSNALQLFNSAISQGGNTVIGEQAASGLISGVSNLILGQGAGANYTSTESSNIIIGSTGTIGDSNTIRIGQTGVLEDQQSNCYIAGIDGVDVGSVASVVSILGDHLGTTTITAGTGITITPGTNTITVSLSGGGTAIDSINVDASTAPGTDPVVADGSGQITVTGAQIASNSTSNVIRTNSLAANTYTIEVQRSTTAAATDVNLNGVSHFDSARFTVDANGFVSTSGTGIANTITGDTGGALSPTAGNWNILGDHGINTSGTGSTLTVAINNAITLGDLSSIATGSNALSATTGDINIASGNLKLPVTSAAFADGVITIGTTRFHNFGTNNLFMGITAGNATLTGSANYGIGTSSLTALTSGSDNIAIGVNSGSALQNGTGNVSMGTSSFTTATSASSNTAIGVSSLRLNATGAQNTAVGNQALRNVLGANNTAVGYQAGNAYTGTEANNISIGSGVTGTLGESGTTRIGANQTACYIDGIDGVNVGSVATVVTEAGDRLGTAVITAGSGITVTPGANAITISLSGGGTAIDSINVDAATGPGTDPVVSDGAGQITVTGGQIASNSTANVIRTNSLAANTYTIEVQQAGTAAAEDTTLNGVAHFNSAQFSVSNGFVSLVDGGFAWNDVSGAFSPLAQNGYFVTGTATGTLPASPTQGDTIKFFVDHATQDLTIQASGTQLIRMGTLVSSAGGTSLSTQQGDSVELVYRAANDTWQAVDFVGTWILA